MTPILNIISYFNPFKLFVKKESEALQPAQDAIAQSAPALEAIKVEPRKTGKRKFPEPSFSPALEGIGQSSSVAKTEPLKKHKTEIPAFFERNFFSRISRAQKRSLTTKLEKLKDQPLSEEALRAFSEGNWAHPIFKAPNWSLLAFRACAEGSLSEMDTSKLFLYEEASTMTDFQTHDLGDPDSERAFLTSLKAFYSLEDFQKLPKMKREDTQFFTFRFPLQKEEDALAAREQRAVDVINFGIHGLKFPIHAIVHENDVEVFVIPPRLWMEVLKSKYGNKAVFPEPVLGYSDADRFHNTSKRIVGIPFSFVSLPEKIHDFAFTKWLGLFFHDLFHTIIESADEHRDAWNDIVQNVKLDEKVLNEIDDRNFPLYARPELHETTAGRKLEANSEKFWYSLASFEEHDLKDFEKPENREEVLRYILSSPRFQQKHDINFHSLEICAQREPEKCSYSVKPWLASAQTVQADLERKKRYGFASLLEAANVPPMPSKSN